MLDIRVLDTDDEITAAFSLMSALRDRIREDSFVAEVRRQQRDGYILAGGFIGETLVVLAGIRPGHTLARGEHVFVDDLVTDEGRRGEGYGEAMLSWVSARARAAGVPRVYLDSRATAKGFYERVGYTFLTSIPCWKDTGTP